MRDEAGRVIGYRALDRIGQTLAPVMLRRRKAEVLTQLPERVDNRIFVPLTPRAARAPRRERRASSRASCRAGARPATCPTPTSAACTCALQNMRMACNSTWLLDHETDHGHKVDELMTLLDELLEDAGRQGRGLQPVAGHARADRAPPGRGKAARLGPCAVQRQRAGRQARRAGRALPRRSELPPVPVHRRRRRGPEPAARGGGGGQHGPAVEPGGAGAAHRPRAPHGPVARRAGGQLRRPGQHRGGHALGAGVQEVAVRRRARRRRERGVPAGHALVASS